MCKLDDNSLRLGAGGKHWDRTCYRSAISDDTDENGNTHGDQYPYSCDPAGKYQFFLLFDSHETKEDMRHTEVAKAPCYGRYNRKQAVRCSRSSCPVMKLGYGEVTG